MTELVAGHISQKQAVDLWEKYQRTRASIARVAKENEARVEGMVRTVEAVVGAGAVAYATARFGKDGAPLNILGFDAELVIGAGLVVGGLLEVAGNQSEHLYNLGAGCLAAYAAREGMQMGLQAQAKVNPTLAAKLQASGYQPAANTNWARAAA